MPRKSLADKPIVPWREALLDTWVYPALTAGFLATYYWPGGDLLLLALATTFGVFWGYAYWVMLRTHRRRAAWQRAQWQASELPPPRWRADEFLMN